MRTPGAFPTTHNPPRAQESQRSERSASNPDLITSFPSCQAPGGPQTLTVHEAPLVLPLPLLQLWLSLTSTEARQTIASGFRCHLSFSTSCMLLQVPLPGTPFPSISFDHLLCILQASAKMSFLWEAFPDFLSRGGGPLPGPLAPCYTALPGSGSLSVSSQDCEFLQGRNCVYISIFNFL